MLPDSFVRLVRQPRLLITTAVFGCLLAACLIVAPLTTQAAPGINQTMNFQGKLTNPDKTNVDNDTYSVVFALYTADTGGAPIWTETQNVTTSAGIFRVLLGSVSSLASVNFNQDQLYLGMTVESDAEMEPRMPLSAAPYAFNAKQVNGLSVTNNGGNTLNIAANKGLTVSNTLAFSGTDSSSINFGAGGTVCYTSASCVTNNSLNFSHLVDTLSLDAATSIALGSNTISTSGTGAIAFGHTGVTSFAGFVGIGEDVPERVLDIFGSGVNNTTGDADLRITATGGTGAGLELISAAIGGGEWSIFSTNDTSFAGGGSLAFWDKIAAEYRFVINDSGNISIGLTQATTKLDVDGLIRVRNPQGETTAPTRSNNGEFAFAYTNPNGRLYFRANDTNYYINDSGTGDYSEYFLKANPQEKYPVGTITSLDGGRLRKTQAGSSVLGLVSAFGTRGNDNLQGDRHLDANYANIGLLGQLPILVSSEQGAINVGDKIGHPQAIAGVGVKATADNSTVAIAMQAFKPQANCPAAVSIESIKWPKEVKNQNPDNLCFTLPSGTVIGRIMAYISTDTINGQAASTQALITAMGLNADQSEISTNLDLSVKGDLRVQGGLTVGGPVEFQGPAIFKAMAEFVDTVIFRKNVTFEQDVAVNGTLWLNKDAAGLARINPGQKSVRVTFEGQYQQTPVVSTSLNDTTVTTEAYQAYIASGLCDISNGPQGCQDKLRQGLLSQDTRFIISHQDATGFTVELEKPTQQQLTFSWIALMVKDKKVIED